MGFRYEYIYMQIDKRAEYIFFSFFHRFCSNVKSIFQHSCLSIFFNM